MPKRASLRSLPCSDVMQYARAAAGAEDSQCNRLQPIGYPSRSQPDEAGDLTVVLYAIKTSQYSFPEAACRALYAEATVLLKTCAAKQTCKGLYLAGDERTCPVCRIHSFNMSPHKSASKSLFTDSKPTTNIHSFCIPQIQNFVRVNVMKGDRIFYVVITKK